MDGFPTLRTERLVLSQLQEEDIPLIVTYAGDEQVAAYTLNIPHPYEKEDAVFWLGMAEQGYANEDQYIFAIRNPTNLAFMGGVGLRLHRRHDRAVLGYWIGVPFWGKGYMTEAVRAVMHFGFDTLHLNRIDCTHLIDNPASGKVMIKNGMIREGELRDYYKKDGQYQSVVQYRLTRAEYNLL